MQKKKRREREGGLSKLVNKRRTHVHYLRVILLRASGVLWHLLICVRTRLSLRFPSFWSPRLMTWRFRIAFVRMWMVAIDMVVTALPSRAPMTDVNITITGGIRGGARIRRLGLGLGATLVQGTRFVIYTADFRVLLPHTFIVNDVFSPSYASAGGSLLFLLLCSRVGKSFTPQSQSPRDDLSYRTCLWQLGGGIDSVAKYFGGNVHAGSLYWYHTV